VVQQWKEWLLEFYVFFGLMGSPTVWFDGLYFGPFVRRIVSTFNFSANFVFHFIFLSDTDILRCHRHIGLVFILLVMSPRRGSTPRQTDRQTGWLAGWLADWLAGWLTD
jgi:hypothetical protein